MIPFYIFYSMFGFQRTGDSIWAMADQLARGFLIGATAGRTTLTGEGLQHADGHSPLLAATNPAVVHYDPAFAYEISHIMQSGLERMYGEDAEDVIFYVTVYNEPSSSRPSRRASTPRDPPGHAPHLEGEGEGTRVQLLASGVAYPWIRTPPGCWPRVGRPVRHLVGHLLERAGARRRGRRGVEPAPPRPGAARRTSRTG